MSLASIQFDEDLVPGVEVKDNTVAGVVVALVLVLGYGTCPHLEGDTGRTVQSSSGLRCWTPRQKVHSTVLATCRDTGAMNDKAKLLLDETTSK